MLDILILKSIFLFTYCFLHDQLLLLQAIKRFLCFYFGVKLRVTNVFGIVTDESPRLKHDGPGLLSMAIADRDTLGSHFLITFKANNHLDRFVNVVFH